MYTGGDRLNLTVLKGPNFSGRTQKLREWVGLPSEPGMEAECSQSAYVGPSAVNNLSGIAPTVSAEIDLMAADLDAALDGKRTLEDLGFGYCLGRNPFTLSGGEQVVSAVVGATVGRPRRLAIDCALEHLSPETRAAVLAYLARLDGELMIADNRLDEWHNGSVVELGASESSPVLRPDPSAEPAWETCEIELLDLCYSYVKGRPVLKNFNMKFEAGAQYWLKGANGSGKTTLSKILCGLLKPNSGEIRVNGKAIQPWRRPGTVVSYAFQDPDLQLFASSVSAQLAHTKRPDKVMRWFGLGQYSSAHPLDLPFVLRKRLAIAAAVGRELGFTILDEPTVGQDLQSALDSKAFGNSNTRIVVSHSRIYTNDRIVHL